MLKWEKMSHFYIQWASQIVSEKVHVVYKTQH